MSIDLVGSNGIWRVQREYYIRHVLRPLGTSAHPIELIRHDGSRLQNFSLLPSAFVAWDLDWSNESNTFYGGGFGHGVGMSQNGVRELVNRGWPREQIIQHYFPGTEIGNVYR
jgi:stage II sporulation protein D